MHQQQQLGRWQLARGFPQLAAGCREAACLAQWLFGLSKTATGKEQLRW